MIDAARALRDKTVAEIDTHEAKIARLRLLADALEAFIEQPERTLEDGHAVGTDTPASATEPPAPSRVAESRRRPRGTGAASRGPSAPASNHAGARDAKLIAAGPYPCPGCGREFSRPQGVGRHRPFCPGSASAPAPDSAIAEVEPKPDHAGHPSRVEKFLCGRNCGQSFLSRQGRNDHERRAECVPKATRPPVQRTEFRVNPIGAGAGMGE